MVRHNEQDFDLIYDTGWWFKHEKDKNQISQHAVSALYLPWPPGLLINISAGAQWELGGQTSKNNSSTEIVLLFHGYFARKDKIFAQNLPESHKGWTF